MTKTDELLREFAERWMPMVRYKDKERFIECIKELFKQVEEERMPSEEEILTEAMERFTDMVTGYFQVQTYHAFIKGAKWLRSRLTKDLEDRNNANEHKRKLEQIMLEKSADYEMKQAESMQTQKTV